jgi:hypothetical protein
MTVISAFAIFGIDDVIPGMLNDPLKTHILNNLDNYNSFLFGIFTGSLVSLIVAVVGYVTEKRRIIAEIWNSGKKLFLSFRLLILDNIIFKDLTHEKLLEIIKQKEFNQQVREWLGYHGSNYIMNIMQLEFLFPGGRMTKSIEALNADIVILCSVVDGFMNAFVNEKLDEVYGEVDVEKLYNVITYRDEKKVLNSVQENLEKIFCFLNKK